MKKKFLIWGIILLVLGGFVFLRYSVAQKQKYAVVKITSAAMGDVKAYLSTTAAIKSKNSKDYFGLSGKVISINVKVGSSVKSGQVMVKYDTADLNTPVTSAQIQYNGAVSQRQDAINTNNQNIVRASDYNYDQIISDYTAQLNDIKNKISEKDNEISKLLNSKKSQDIQIVSVDRVDLNGGIVTGLQQPVTGLITQRDSLISQINGIKSQKSQLQPMSPEKLKQLDNSVALAMASLNAAKVNQSKGADSIIADFDGVVTAVSVVQGQMGNAAQAAVTVQDLSKLKGVVAVGKYDAAKIQTGQEATFKATDKSEYKGKVSFMEPAAKQTVTASGSDSSLSVDVDVIDSTKILRIGFDYDVDILLGRVNSVIKIPVECIKSDKNDKSYVYLIIGNKAVEKEVKLGLQSDTEAQITQGVKEGEKVILNPSTSITNGSFVKESVGVGK